VPYLPTGMQQQKRKGGNAPKLIAEVIHEKAAPPRADPPEDVTYGEAEEGDSNVLILPSDSRKRKAKEEPPEKKRLSVSRCSSSHQSHAPRFPRNSIEGICNSNAHSHTSTLSVSLPHFRSFSRTRTHTHTHPHTHAHTHTHTLSLCPGETSETIETSSRR
jgi:hypothetical protein